MRFRCVSAITDLKSSLGTSLILGFGQTADYYGVIDETANHSI